MGFTAWLVVFLLTTAAIFAILQYLHYDWGEPVDTDSSSLDED